MKHHPLSRTIAKHRKIVIYLLLALPVVIYMLPILLSGNLIASGDADYQFQFYDAFRRSILEFHQFPWWNPWVSGGVPLFANAQFGPLSIQSLLVLPFGAVMGIKLSFLIYLLIGFFSMRALVGGPLKAPKLTAILIAYIWTFSSFSAYRMTGHFTFMLFHFLPLVFYLYLTRKAGKWRWLQLGLVFSLMIWSSPHYSTIMTMLVLGIFFIADLSAAWIKQRKSAHVFRDFLQTTLLGDLKFWAKTGLLTLVLSGYRLYFALAFIHDFPRPGNAFPEPYFGVKNTFLALFGPLQYGSHAPVPPIWSWMEASYSIGTPTLLALILLFIWSLRKIKKLDKIYSYSPWVLTVIILLFVLLAQGRFAVYAPFSLLQKLPVLDSMRVAMRWLLPSSFVLLLLIGAYRAPQFRKSLNLLLSLSVIQLFVTGMLFTTTAFTLTQQPYTRSKQAPFEQQISWDANRVIYDENLLGGTENNYGQVIAADSLVDTRAPGSTVRCDVDEGCSFVLTHNARVTYWSPNLIRLERTGKGPIQLNMNPGDGWTINSRYAFKNLKVTDPTGTFTISYPDSTFILRYAPRLSPQWLLTKAGIL